MHLRTEIYHQWIEFCRLELPSSQLLMRNMVRCLHRHCKKQSLHSLHSSHHHPALRTDQVDRYLQTLLARLLATLNLSPDHLPSVVLLALLRTNILHQLRPSNQNYSSQGPRSSGKLLKDLNRMRPRICPKVDESVRIMQEITSLYSRV